MNFYKLLLISALIIIPTSNSFSMKGTRKKEFSKKTATKKKVIPTPTPEPTPKPHIKRSPLSEAIRKKYGK